MTTRPHPQTIHTRQHTHTHKYRPVCSMRTKRWYPGLFPKKELREIIYNPILSPISLSLPSRKVGRSQRRRARPPALSLLKVGSSPATPARPSCPFPVERWTEIYDNDRRWAGFSANCEDRANNPLFYIKLGRSGPTCGTLVCSRAGDRFNQAIYMNDHGAYLCTCSVEHTVSVVSSKVIKLFI